MNDAALAHLNFKTLLHYDATPDAGSIPTGGIKCNGFCVSCEKQDLLAGSGLRLDQMSHGADTSDFERSITKLPTGGIDHPIAFILESPGGYYGNGRKILHEGTSKQPPVNHYYWTPKLTEWPTTPAMVNGRYGPYFAYIIASHKLKNAYFTNMVKCSLAKQTTDQFVRFKAVKNPKYVDARVRENCYENFLSKEMDILQPKLVFYFGSVSQGMGHYSGLKSFLASSKFVTLRHPAARGTFMRTILENDERIHSALEGLG